MATVTSSLYTGGNFDIHSSVLGDIISADNFTGKPEAMVEVLKTVPAVKHWKWIPVKGDTL
jgi:hypothetical protein